MTNYCVFPNCNTRQKMISALYEKYPSIKHSFIGRSACDRGIDSLHIGNTKNRVLYCGGFHGSEYLTVLALLKFLEECAYSMETNTKINGYNIGDSLKIRGLTIVPCVNPDGVEIAINGSASAQRYQSLVEKV